MRRYRTFVHYGLHFLAPGVIAWIIFPEQWKIVWIIMLATMVVDIDHLLAKPMFDANRCSIGFHPFHTYPAIGFYALMLFVPNFYVQVAAIGLLFHMFTDWQDCLWMKTKHTVT